MTYVYTDSTAVVGPLATTREPHSYDLCDDHARKLTAPRGWELVRTVGEYATPMPSDDDLVALANAVREAAKAGHDGAPPAAEPPLRPDTKRRDNPSRLPPPGGQRPDPIGGAPRRGGSATPPPAPGQEAPRRDPLGGPARPAPSSGDATGRRHLRVVGPDDQPPAR